MNMSEHFTSVLRVRQAHQSSEVQLSVSSDGKAVSLPQLNPAPPTSSRVQRFTFDGVYAASEDDKTVYRNGVRKIVESTLLGYNGTVLSLEIGAADNSKRLHDSIARASEQIFRCLKKSKSSVNLVVNCSFVAVASERAYDLLAGFSALKDGREVTKTEPPCFRPLSCVDDRPEASVHEAESQSQVFTLLEHGHGKEAQLVAWLDNQQRAEETTNGHYHHTILSLTVEYSHFGTMNAPVSGALSFVRLSRPRPLARRDQYSAEGGVDHRVLSLLALEELVTALTPDTSSSADQPSLQSASPQQPEDEKLYSKSLLTRLMKDALGGNCKTVFMCSVPESLPTSCLPEASAALRLVSRARHIQNKPNRRDLAERALMSAYMRELRLRYHTASSQGEGEGGHTSSSGTNSGAMKEEERQHAMELAASALAQAVGDGGEQGDSENSEDEEERGGFASPLHQTNPQTRKISVNLQSKKATQETKGYSLETSTSSVTIDTLVGVLQNPDRGVPRALETRLKDVKIRRDAGALFSGAGIVEWMLGNVEGVESEKDAVTLGQLMLNEGAIFHSEGSMVFANADSLFYYAREARHGKRSLSPEEIQRLLSHARQPDTTNVTSVSIRGDGDMARGREKQGGPEEDGEQERNINQEARGAGDGQSLRIHSPTWEEEQLYDGNHVLGDSTEAVDQCSPLHSSYDEATLQPPVDQSGAQGGVGDVQTGSQASVESWMNTQEMDGQVMEGYEGEGESGNIGNPNTTPQKSIPSIHTLENSSDYPHALHMAVAVGKQPGVIRNLVMMVGVDKTDEQGRTPLMFAALGNKRASCTTLIDCGANVDTQDASGLTALHVACYHGAKEATRVLLSRKASVTAVDKMGHTALHWSTVPDNTACLQLLLQYMWPAVLKEVDSSGLTALHWAIFYNHPHHLKLLLKKYSDEVGVDSSGRTLLTYAIERDPPTRDCINVLIECCPYLVTLADSNGRLPLHMASITTSSLPLSLLITNRSTTLDMNCVDPSLRTPLHYAAAANNLENVQVLLSVSADSHAVDSEGRTALDYAGLLDNGADMVALLSSVGGSCDSSANLHDTDALPNSHSLPTRLDSWVTTGPDDPSKACTIL